MGERIVALGREPSGESSLFGAPAGRLAPLRYNADGMGLAPLRYKVDGMGLAPLRYKVNGMGLAPNPLTSQLRHQLFERTEMTPRTRSDK